MHLRFTPALLAAGLLSLPGRAFAGLTASPTAVTVPKTQISAPITVDLTFVSGIPGTTGTLGITGLPPGAATVPAPVTYPTSPSQTSASTSFRISVSAATAPGTYVIGITDPPPPTGRNAGFKNITLTVPAPSVLTVSPPSVSVFPTQTSALLTVDASFPFSTSSGTSTLSFSGLPAGASTNPSPVTYGFLTGSTSSSTTLRVATTAATVPGTYTVTVSDPAPPGGKGPSSTNFTLKVLAPSFSASASPNPVTLTVGAAAQTIAVLTTVDTGFTGPITYSFSGFPGGVSTGGTRTATSPFGPVTFPFSATAGTPAGTYNGTLTGQAASGTKTFPMTVVVQQPDIGVSFGSPTATVCNGGPAASNTIQLTPQSGYAGTPQVGFTSVPAGLSITPSPLTSSPLPPVQTIAFSVSASGASAGLHTLTLNVSDPSAGVSKAASLPVTVTNPDFTPATTPGSVTLQAGGGAQTFIASLTPVNCFSPAWVTIAPSGAPAGITFTPASSTVSSPSYGPATFTVQAVTAVSPATYPITFTFTPSGGAARSTPASVIVTAAPDFSLGAAPATLNLTAGGSGTTSVQVTGLNGFAGNVDVSMPSVAGVTFTPSAFTLAAGAARTVTATAAASAPTGTFSAAINGTGGPGTRSTGLTVVISAAPDFSLAANPSALTLTPGSSGTTTVSATGLNGFSGSVNVTAPSLPNVTLTPATFNLSPGGSQVVSVSASGAATPGTLSGLFAGTAAGVTGTRTAPLSIAVVRAPDFSLSASPAALTLAPGGTGTVTVSASSLNGFSGSVSVTAPSAPNLTISPASFALAPGGSQIVTIAADPSAPMVTTPITFTGNASGVAGTRQATVNVTIAPGPDFSLSVLPAAVTLAPGGSVSATVWAAGLNGFAGAVSVTVTPVPNLTITPSTFTLSTGASQAVTLMAAAGTPPATVTASFIGAAAGIAGTRQATVAVTVTSVPDFNLAASPPRIDLVAGGSATAVVSATALNGFTGAISVTTAAPPNVAVTPSAFTLTAGGSQSVTVAAAAGAPPTPSPLTLTFLGTGAGVSGARSAGLEVTIAPAPDFALSIDPASFALPPGGSSQATLSLTAINGFAGTAAVTATPPAGIVVTPASFSVSAASPQRLTISAGASAPLGVFMLSFSGTAPGVTGSRGTTAQATVTAAPDFTLSASPPRQTLPPGGMGTVRVSLTGVNGFLATADVTVDAPAAFSVSPDRFPLGPGRTQDVEVRASPSTASGTFTLTFRAVAPGIATLKTAAAEVAVAAAPDFTLTVSPSQAVLHAGEAVDLTALVTPFGGFGGEVSLTVAGLPPSSSLEPAAPMLRFGTPHFLTLQTSRRTPPGSYALTFRGTPAAGGAPPRTATVALQVLVASPSFTVIASPAAVQAAPGQAIGILYTFRSSTNEPLTIVADTLVRRSAAGVEFDRTEETVGIALPPRGIATWSNTVSAAADQFASAGSPAIVIEDRTFRAAPDSFGVAASASAAVSITPVNPLLSTVSATRVSLVYPPTGTPVGRGDTLRAQGLLMGSGSGPLLVGWFFDGLLVETATVPMQNGTPASVTTAVSMPTLMSGVHQIVLAVLSPNTISSPPVQVVIEDGQKTLRLVSPAGGASYLPGLSVPTFVWVPVPGIARYAVGLKRSGEPESVRRWFRTSETRWGLPAGAWNELADGHYEWVVRGFTGVGRSTLDAASGGATAPATSDSTPDVAEGWTVTSSTGTFSIGDAGGLASLEGTATSKGGFVAFSWKPLSSTRYLHILYERSAGVLKRVGLALVAEPGRRVPRERLPRADLLWRAIALDEEGRPVASTNLLRLEKGAGR